MVRPNVRKWVMATPSLADLMPTTSVWSGYKKNPCRYYKESKNDPVLFYALTAGSTPFRGCLHSGDVGHSFIGGPTRSGKTVLLNFIAAQESRYKDFQNYIFDHGWGSLPLCYAMNGVHYDIGFNDSKVGFKPLANLERIEDFSFVLQWLIEIAEINGYKVGSEHRVMISEVLNIIREQGTSDQRTLSYFYLQLKSKNQDFAKVYLPYTKQNKGSGLQSTLFDSTEDALKFNRLNVFEMSTLAKQGDPIYIPAVRFILHSIWRGLDGRPTSVKFDEFWYLIKNPVFCAVFADIANAFAKKN